MDIATRNLSIQDALITYRSCVIKGCCTSYVIIRETDGVRFGVVPKITSCGRFFRQWYCTRNYYTNEQANATQIGLVIGNYLHGRTTIIESVLEALVYLSIKFDDEAARPFIQVAEQHRNRSIGRTTPLPSTSTPTNSARSNTSSASNTPTSIVVTVQPRKSDHE